MPTPDRHWLITWTTYGSWLPGDARGFVGNIREPDGTQVIHNIPGTPYDADMPNLKRWVEAQMKGQPISLDRNQAEAMVAQYLETCRIRRWNLEAASVMYNHTHVLVGVFGDPDPEAILNLFKSWATRALKKLGPLPQNGDWWTTGGSKRKIADTPAAVIYVVKKQPNPLAVYYATGWQPILDAYDRSLGMSKPDKSV